MNKHDLNVATDQINQFIRELQTLPDAPIGDHLSDEDAIGYTMETLDQQEFQRVDNHLASCFECAGELEDFFEKRQVWEGTTGEQRLAELAAQIKSKMAKAAGAKAATAKAAMAKAAGAKAASAKSVQPELLELLCKLTEQLTVDFSKLGKVFGVMPQLADDLTDQPPFWRVGEALEGALEWEIREIKQENSLLISFGTDRPELNGIELHLEIGPWKRDLVLSEPEGESEAGKFEAQTELTRAERTHIPEGAVLKVELMLENPDTDS